MPYKNPLIGREQSRLTMAIRKAEENGEDASELRRQREELKNQNKTGTKSINGEKYKSINEESINQQEKHKSINGIKSINTIGPKKQKSLETELLQNVYSELKILTSEIKQIKEFQTTFFSQLITTKKEPSINKPIKTNEEVKIIEPRPTIPKPINLIPKINHHSTDSQSKKVDLAIEYELFQKLESWLSNHSELFPNKIGVVTPFGGFLRSALLAYQNQELTIESTQYLTSAKKKDCSLRLAPEIRIIYEQLTLGRKRQELNQILDAYLKTHN